MIPRSLSASSVIVAEACLARWVAEYFYKGDQPSGSAANLGTLCHSVLETWVKEDFHTDPSNSFVIMEKVYESFYYEYFENDQRYDEGLEMLRRWHDRSHPLPYTVLSTEVKEEFPLRVGGYEIPFRYVWDRSDARTDATCSSGCCPLEVDIIDYKSVMMPISPQGLNDHMQARCYGLAGQIRYPHAERVWVTLDLLRYGAVGTVFRREQNVATYKYIKNLAKRILQTAVEDAAETVNPTCRFCIRKTECASLRGHALVGGVYGIEDPGEAADRRYALDNQRKGIEAAVEVLDKVIIGHCEQEDITEFESDTVKVRLDASRRRRIDAERASRVLGPDLMTKYGQLRLGDIDVLLKGDEITEDQKAELRRLITKTYGSIGVKVTPKNPID